MSGRGKSAGRSNAAPSGASNPDFVALKPVQRQQVTKILEVRPHMSESEAIVFARKYNFDAQEIQNGLSDALDDERNHQPSDWEEVKTKGSKKPKAGESDANAREGQDGSRGERGDNGRGRGRGRGAARGGRGGGRGGRASREGGAQDGQAQGNGSNASGNQAQAAAKPTGIPSIWAGKMSFADKVRPKEKPKAPSPPPQPAISQPAPVSEPAAAATVPPVQITPPEQEPGAAVPSKSPRQTPRAASPRSPQIAPQVTVPGDNTASQARAPTPHAQPGQQTAQQPSPLPTPKSPGLGPIGSRAVGGRSGSSFSGRPDQPSPTAQGTLQDAQASQQGLPQSAALSPRLQAQQPQPVATAGLAPSQPKSPFHSPQRTPTQAQSAQAQQQQQQQQQHQQAPQQQSQGQPQHAPQGQPRQITALYDDPVLFSQHLSPQDDASNVHIQFGMIRQPPQQKIAPAVQTPAAAPVSVPQHVQPQQQQQQQQQQSLQNAPQANRFGGFQNAPRQQYGQQQQVQPIQPQSAVAAQAPIGAPVQPSSHGGYSQPVQMPNVQQQQGVADQNTQQLDAQGHFDGYSQQGQQHFGGYPEDQYVYGGQPHAGGYGVPPPSQPQGDYEDQSAAPLQQNFAMMYSYNGQQPYDYRNGPAQRGGAPVRPGGPAKKDQSAAPAPAGFDKNAARPKQPRNNGAAPYVKPQGPAPAGPRTANPPKTGKFPPTGKNFNAQPQPNNYYYQPNYGYPPYMPQYYPPNQYGPPGFGRGPSGYQQYPPAYGYPPHAPYGNANQGYDDYSSNAQGQADSQQEYGNAAKQPASNDAYGGGQVDAHNAQGFWNQQGDDAEQGHGQHELHEGSYQPYSHHQQQQQHLPNQDMQPQQHQWSFNYQQQQQPYAAQPQGMGQQQQGQQLQGVPQQMQQQGSQQSQPQQTWRS